MQIINLFYIFALSISILSCQQKAESSFVVEKEKEDRNVEVEENEEDEPFHEFEHELKPKSQALTSSMALSTGHHLVAPTGWGYSCYYDETDDQNYEQLYPCSDIPGLTFQLTPNNVGAIYWTPDPAINEGVYEFILIAENTTNLEYNRLDYSVSNGPPSINAVNDTITGSFLDVSKAINVGTNDTANVPCGTIADSGSVTAVVNVSVSGSYPNYTITPSATNWSFSYQIECSLDDTTTDTATVSGTAGTAQIDLVTTISAPSNVAVGADLVFTIQVLNNGPQNATGVSFYLQCPNHTQYKKNSGIYDNPFTGTGSHLWTVGTVFSGQTQTRTLTCTALASGAGQVVSGRVVDSTLAINTQAIANETDDDTTASTLQADVTIVAGNADLVTVVSVEPYASGTCHEVDSIKGFNITVTNNGPEDAYGVSVTSLCPENTSYFGYSGGGTYDEITGLGERTNPIASGATATLIIFCKIESTGSGETSVEFSSTAATSQMNDPTNVGNVLSTQFNICEAQADLETVKSVDHKVVDPMSPPDSLTYTIRVGNNGPNTATNVDLTDFCPDPGVKTSYDSHSVSQGTYDSVTGLWDIGTIVVGQPAVLTLVCDLLNPGGLNSWVTNTTEAASGDELDPTSEGDSLSVSTDTGAVKANLITDKDCQGSSGGGTAGGPKPIAPVGGGARGGPCPGEGGVPNALVGEIVDFHIYVTNTGDGFGGGGTATDISLCDVCPNNMSYADHDVSIGTYDKPSAGFGGLGHSNGSGVACNDPEQTKLPPGTPIFGKWHSFSLAVGEEAVLVLRCVADSASSTMTNVTTAAVSPTSFDPDTTLDDYTAVVQTDALQANLVTKKSASPSIVSDGDLVNFSITVQNNGVNSTTNVNLTDQCPNPLQYQYHSAPGTNGYNSVTGEWDIGSLSNGAIRMLTLTCLVPVGTVEGSYVNTTTAATTPDSVDNTTVGDDLSATVTVALETNLVTQVSVNTSYAEVGDTLTYTLNIENSGGPEDATNVEAEIECPSGTYYDSHSVPVGSYNTGNGDWDIPVINVGQDYSLTLMCIIEAGEEENYIDMYVSAATSDFTDPTGSGDILNVWTEVAAGSPFGGPVCAPDSDPGSISGMSFSSEVSTIQDINHLDAPCSASNTSPPAPVSISLTANKNFNPPNHGIRDHDYLLFIEDESGGYCPIEFGIDFYNYDSDGSSAHCGGTACFEGNTNTYATLYNSFDTENHGTTDSALTGQGDVTFNMDVFFDKYYCGNTGHPDYDPRYKFFVDYVDFYWTIPAGSASGGYEDSSVDSIPGYDFCTDGSYHCWKYDLDNIYIDEW